MTSTMVMMMMQLLLLLLLMATLGFTQIKIEEIRLNSSQQFLYTRWKKVDIQCTYGEKKLGEKDEVEKN